MKKAFLISLIVLLSTFCFAQSTPGCGLFVNHATINLSNVSNQTISGDSINAAGGQYCIRLTNCTNIRITKCKLIGASTSSYSGSIDIHGGSNITIDTCYFENSSYGILVQGVTLGGIIIRYNYFKNIEQIGRPTKGGCSVQFNGVSGPNLICDYNKSYHTTNNANIGDQFSFFKVNGTSTSPLHVYYNQVRGGSTEPSGLSGNILGDLGGSWQDAEYNTYVNAGAQGQQVQGASNIIMSNNRIYSYKVPNSFEGMAYGNYSGAASTNVTMANNRINFTLPNGKVFNKWFDPNTVTAPAGWSTNTPDSVPDTSIKDSMLPDPLFGPCQSVTPKPVITYSPSTYVFTTGTAISNLIPSNTGGSSSSWSVSPSLPAGLVISATTGIVSGTPTAVTSAQNYVVSATNAGGTGNFTLNIQTKAPIVNKPVISYSPNNITVTVNTAIPTLNASNTGSPVTSWGISPSLPSNLVFNNGTISGIPVATQTATVYTVSATNSAGTGTAQVTITVNPVKPNISYAGTPYTFTQGSTIVPISPSNSGGPATYSVSPALPSGLSLASNGILSGTPSTTQGATPYNITATNAGGNSVFPISITINAPAVTPPNISYSPSSQTGTINVPITNMAPVNSGGAATGFTCSPSLPTGLNFNTSNGLISGTSTVVSGSTSYTIVGSNSGGSSTTHVTLQINQIAAPSISYPYSSVVYVQGQAIMPISPTNAGGASASYAITSGTLVPGLTLNTSTGVISGVPSATQSPTNFTVRATNAGGTNDFTIQAAVNAPIVRYWYLVDGKFGYLSPGQ